MDFKTYFQDELAYLKTLAQQFADDYPELAPFLSPHAGERDVEMLFEHFSFLSAHLRQKIEDDFPEITHHLLARLLPLILRPLPASTVMQFETHSNTRQQLKQGTPFYANSKAGEPITFCLCHDLAVLPLTVMQVDSTKTVDGATVTLTLHYHGQTAQSGYIPNQPLRFFLGEDCTLATQCILWFSQYLQKAQLHVGEQVYGIASLADSVIEQNFFQPVLPGTHSQYAHLSLVTEYLSLPHIHDFLTIDFSHEYPQIPCDADGKFQLHFEFNRPFEGALPTQAQFQLNCVAALNIFPFQTEPQKLVGQRHPISLPEDTQLYAVEHVQSTYRMMDSDNMASTRYDYPSATEFVTHHHADEETPLYYLLEQTHNVKSQVMPSLIFLNGKGAPVTLGKAHRPHDFKYHLHCTHLLSAGVIDPQTDFFGDEGVLNHLSIRAVIPNSPTRPANIDANYHWQLISHLSFNPVSLKAVTALRELLVDLNLYEYQYAALQKQWQQQVDQLQESKLKNLDWFFRGELKRGAELTLTMAMSAFENKGQGYRLGCLIAQVMPFCIGESAFIKTKIIDTQTQETWSLAPILGRRKEI